MRYSRLLALAAFFGLVPGGLLLVYLGSVRGLYPSSAIPVVFGVGFAVAVAALFVVLPVVRERLD